MTIPVPPTDNAKGILVVKYTTGTFTHRWRFHLAYTPAADSAGTYSSPGGGRETTATGTFTALAAVLKPFLHTDWTLTMDKLFQVAGGAATEIFGFTAPSPVVGTNGNATVTTPEVYECWNMRSTGGKAFRFFIFQVGGWSYQVPDFYTGSSGGIAGALVAYLAGSATAICARDGNFLQDAAKTTWGENKKLRRRAGDA